MWEYKFKSQLKMRRQHKISAGDAITQTECLAEVNNLGLPPGLTTETVASNQEEGRIYNG